MATNPFPDKLKCKQVQSIMQHNRVEREKKKCYFHLARMQEPWGEKGANLITCQSEQCFLNFYIGTSFTTVASFDFDLTVFHKKLRINSVAGPTIDSKCEPSSQTRKSKRTSMRQYALCDLQFKKTEKTFFSLRFKTLERIFSMHYVSTYRGDLEDTSSIVELHRWGVNCGQSSRVQILPNQRPLKTLDKKQTFHSLHM